MAYLAFLYFFGLDLDLIPREVINPFTNISKSSFGPADVILIFSRLPNFKDMYKVTYLSLPLISMGFLTVRQPQFFIFTAVNSPSVKISSPVNFSSQNIFWVDQPFSIRPPESHGLWVDSITEYGNTCTKCQYVHEIPIRSRLTDGHSTLYSNSRTICKYVAVLSLAR